MVPWSINALVAIASMGILVAFSIPALIYVGRRIFKEEDKSKLEP